MHGRGQMLETGTPVRVDGSVGGGSRLSLTSPADIRRFRVAQALKSIENALILLDSRPAEGVEISALERVQRRANPRVQVVLPVRLGVGDQAEAAVLAGETVDLSTGGCRVMTDRPWPTEADPVVTIELPDGAAVSTQARVVTVDLNGDGWEYRLAFPGIDETASERLSRLVALGG